MRSEQRLLRSLEVANPQQKKRKPGRPKLPKGEAKGKIVPVRLDKGEFERLTAAAKASKQTVSQWMRSKLLADLEG
jgi:hypothetical protein